MAWNNPIPTSPKSFSSLQGKKLRRRAKEAWRAAHTLCNAILAWEMWLNQSQVQYRSEEQYDIETGDAICRAGAAAIRALCGLGVCSHIFHGDAEQSLAWFPPAPSDNLDLTWYVDKVERSIEEQINNYRFHCHQTLKPAARGLLDLLETYPETALSETPSGNPRRHARGRSPEEANEIAMQLANKDASFVNGTAQEWAKKIGCGVGTVHKTKLWQETMQQTKRGRVPGRKPKEVALTEAVLARAGKNDPDEALARLKAEQEKDFEPSPLDPDVPDKPHRVKCRRS
jgi:hypothetical protein